MHSALAKQEFVDHSTSSDPGFVRQVGEAVILLALAVTLFRTFFAEGYMISTGSMAPSLLGYHRRSTCPDCHIEFARGTSVTVDDSGMHAASAGNSESTESFVDSCRCPNCGASVPAEKFPRNEGDQLLVQKHTYAFRDPRRFEVAVFRNPSLPMQAYVKRVVGLPGELIEIIGGDVYADGVLQRKTLPTQLGQRILVDDATHQPLGLEGPVQRWQPESSSVWSSSPTGFRFREVDSSRSNIAALDPVPADPVTESTSDREPHWVTYHHWIRQGGSHRRHVPIDEWPLPLDQPVLFRDHFELAEDGQSLESTGTIPFDVYTLWSRKLAGTSAAVPFRELFDRSHLAPISDVYGYNHPLAADAEFVVGDLMIELEFVLNSHLTGERPGQFLMELGDGRHTFECEFDFSANRVRLRSDGQQDRILREAPIPESLRTTGKGRLILSAFDRQVLVAVDDIPLFDPLLYAADPSRDTDDRQESRRIRFGALKGACEVTQVRLFRDVYYTPSEHNDRYQLQENEFYVLGDNSPVSVDSRVWEHPAVPRRHLIGKPLVVHLPSQQIHIPGLESKSTIRVPDFTRVRTIR